MPTTTTTTPDVLRRARAMLAEREQAQANYGDEYAVYLDDAHRTDWLAWDSLRRALDERERAANAAPVVTTTCSDAHTELTGLFRDEATVARMLPLLGIEAPVGRAFCCVLPGHEERHPSASVHPETFRYVDFHRRDGRAAYTLQEVYASRRYGTVQRYRAGSQAIALWAARLAYDAGVLAMDLPPMYLPADLTRSERNVADGLRLLYALNLDAHPDDPAVMYAVGFAAAWCGVGRTTVTRALRRLRAIDSIRRAPGRVLTRGGREANRYVPGDGTRPARQWKHPTWGDE